MRTPSKNRTPATSFLRLLRPGPTRPLGATLISDKLEEWSTHWSGEREVVCARELGRPCPVCDAGRLARRTIYAIAREFGACDLGILPITAGAYDHCPLLQHHCDDCRGLNVKLSRLRATTCGAVRVEVLPERVPSMKLPTVGDLLRRGLHRLWQLHPADLTVMLASGAEQQPELVAQPAVAVPIAVAPIKPAAQVVAQVTKPDRGAGLDAAQVKRHGLKNLAALLGQVGTGGEASTVERAEELANNGANRAAEK